MASKIEELKNRFRKLDRIESRKEEIEHAKMISMFRFLSKVQQELDMRNWTRKRLANEIGVSESYISQLFHGEKVINLETMVKISKALNAEFELKISPGNLLTGNEATAQMDS